jgi:hypothetical protein
MSRLHLYYLRFSAMYARCRYYGHSIFASLRIARKHSRALVLRYAERTDRIETIIK